MAATAAAAAAAAAAGFRMRGQVSGMAPAPVTYQAPAPEATKAATYMGLIPPEQQMDPMSSQQTNPWLPRINISEEGIFCNGATIAISILAALIVVAVATAVFLLQPSGQGGQVGQATPVPMPTPAPVPTPAPLPATKETLALVEQVGDANSVKRGTAHTPQRKIMNDIWKGTHTARGDVGSVVLSEKAGQLRSALIQKGFKPRVVFHGTERRSAPLILDNGFRDAAIGFFGDGIYVASHETHAMCYGNAIISVEAFWKEPMEKYLKHVNSDNEINDVYKIMDPLLAFPKSVRHVSGADMAESTCI